MSTPKVKTNPRNDRHQLSFQEIYNAIRRQELFSPIEIKFLLRLLHRKQNQFWPRLDSQDLDMKPYPHD
jgi:hypothetical protein